MTIQAACTTIRASVGEVADVYALLSTLPTAEKEAALAARRKGNRRKVVVSTNLAETSLTVEGVRFVVDSGLIAQSEWDVVAAQGGIRTKAHSQAGIKQRWGRVGRKAPGWVFPLYRKDDLLELAEDTAPGSTRENLENLVMTAKMGGISSVTDFPWPAAFAPEPPVVLDAAAEAARQVFLAELERADEALRSNGALDPEGDPTSFGKELSRLQVLGSTGAALAVMYADRLACVPEVATILALLNGTQLVSATGMLLLDPSWPEEWQLEASQRHRGIASFCEDDADMVLQVVAGWERADPTTPPWEHSVARAAWARRWWVNHDTLIAASITRREILAGLSPAMKEEVKRFIEPSLLRRARGAITCAFGYLEHQFDGAAFIPAGTDPAVAQGLIRTGGNTLLRPPARSIPLHRSRRSEVTYLANFVSVEGWVQHAGVTGDPGAAAAISLLVLAAQHARAELWRDVVGAVLNVWPAGSRALMRLGRRQDGRVVVTGVEARHDQAALPDEADRADGFESAVAVNRDLAVAGAAIGPEIRWPTGRQPIPDAEHLAVRAVLDHREVEAGESACGQCAACIAGESAACVDRRGSSVDEQDGPVVDAMAPWLTRATAHLDASNVLIAREDGDDLWDGAWYEVTGYAFADNGEAMILVQTDWRHPDDVNGPGEHPDLNAGDHVDVIVGGTLRDHRGDLRVLWRADGRGASCSARRSPTLVVRTKLAGSP